MCTGISVPITLSHKDLCDELRKLIPNAVNADSVLPAAEVEKRHRLDNGSRLRKCGEFQYLRLSRLVCCEVRASLTCTGIGVVRTPIPLPLV